MSPIPLAKAPGHRPRTCRIFGSLLLVAAAGLSAVSVSPAAARPGSGALGAAAGLDSVVPAPASVTPDDSLYELTEATSIRVSVLPAARGRDAGTGQASGTLAAATRNKADGCGSV